MTNLKSIITAVIAAVVKAAREPSKREQSAAASMHLATQGIAISTMRRD